MREPIRKPMTRQELVEIIRRQELQAFGTHADILHLLGAAEYRGRYAYRSLDKRISALMEDLYCIWVMIDRYMKAQGRSCRYAHADPSDADRAATAIEKAMR